jgi:hypothetical protein
MSILSTLIEKRIVAALEAVTGAWTKQKRPGRSRAWRTACTNYCFANVAEAVLPLNE